MSAGRVGWVRAIAARFRGGFPKDTPKWRTIGREAEHPLVTEHGAAFDVRALWEGLNADGSMKVCPPQEHPGCCVCS